MKQSSKSFKFVGLLLVLGLLFAALPTVQVHASAKWAQPIVHVSKDYTEDGVTYFTTIQAAINAVETGGVVNVAPGNYNEDLVINKALTLQSKDSLLAIVTGVATTSDAGMVDIQASNVRIIGFKFVGTANKTIRLTQPTGNVTFSNNHVVGVETTTGTGWTLFEADTGDAQSNLTISGNTFEGNGQSMLVALTPTITGLTFTNNTFSGDPTSGPVLTIDGMTGTEVITGNSFARITSPYALFEVFGTYDINAIYSANTWPAGYSVVDNKIMMPPPEYNGTVSGVFTTSEMGAVIGTLSGAYALNVSGQVSAYVDNKATFSGTVTGDIVGNITASINEMGIGTLSGTITNTGAVDPVRILGIFPQSGITGDFAGQIITGVVPTLASSMAVTTPGDVSTVFSGRTLQMGVVIDPATAAYGAWSIWEPEGTNTGSTISDTGLLTAGTPGTITVIVKALDGSLLDATKSITIQEIPTKLLMQTPVTGMCNTTVLPEAEFTVNVLIQNVTDLMGFDVEVDFDKTMVQVTKVENGTFLTGDLLYAPTNGFDNASGKVNYGVTLKGDTYGVVAPVDGSGTLFTITFKPLKAGVSAFSINAAGSKLVHYDSYLLIPYEITGGTSVSFGGVVRNDTKSLEYCDLATAVADANASGDVLKLLADINIPKTVTVNKVLKLDLNGKLASFTPSTDNTHALSVATGGTLTIDDSSTGGTIRAIGESGRGINVNGGSLVVNGGSIQGEYASVNVQAGSSMTLNAGSIGGLYETTKYSGIGVAGTNATLTVTGGTIQSYDFGIYGNGSAGNGGTIINIQGGSITSDDLAIYHPQAGTLNISGGTISGLQAVEMRSGTLNVTSGTIHATGTFVPTASLDLKNGYSTDSGDAIFVGTSAGGYAGNVQVSISGSTAEIKSDYGYALREAVNASITATNTHSITVTGGMLTGGVDLDTTDTVYYAGAAVTFSDKLVAANTEGTSDLDLLPGGKYNTDPSPFVYAPYGSYLADPWWEIANLTASIAWDPGHTGQVVGGDPLGVVVDGDNINFTGLIEWYPTVAGLHGEGNMVGVQITAPAGFPTTGTTFTFNENSYTWDAVKDGNNYVWIYPRVTAPGQTWSVVVTWKEGVTQTFNITVTTGSTLNEASALTWLQANTTITGTLDHLVANFPPYIPQVIADLPYQINSRMTLAAPLPAGSTVTIEASADGATWLPYVTDVTLPGATFWITELFDPDATPANFDAGYAGKVEHYRVTINSNPVTVDTTLKVESIISKTGFGVDTGLVILATKPDILVLFVKPLDVTGADLKAGSTSGGPYTLLSGNFMNGFTMELDPTVSYYYLDVDNLSSSNPLKDGSYPFYLDKLTVPAGFFEYWATKGVDADATGGWEAVMYDIVTGELPIFYAKVEGTIYTLIDGLEYEMAGETLAGPLKIDGEYFTGAYTFTGSLTDKYDTTDNLTIGINFTRANVELVQGTVSMQGRTVKAGVPVTLAGTFGYGPYPIESFEQSGFNLTFTDIASGTYTVTTNQPRYLNVSADLNKTITNLDADPVISALQLKGGNARWMDSATLLNNEVNIGDATLVGNQYGTSGTSDEFGNNGDCNFDGKVNIQDLALVGGNFDLTAAVAYQNWMP